MHALRFSDYDDQGTPLTKGIADELLYDESFEIRHGQVTATESITNSPFPLAAGANKPPNTRKTTQMPAMDE